MGKLDKALSKIIRKYYYQITPPQEQRNRDIVKELHTLIRQREKELLKKVRQSIGKGNVLEGTGRRIVSVISTLNDLEELSDE